MDNSSQEILLLDPNTGSYRQLALPAANGRLIGLDWSHDGCQLYTALRTPGGIEFFSLNLMGEVLGRLPRIIAPEDQGGTQDSWAISPNGNWVAYVAHSGSQGLYYSEYQDVEVVPTGDTTVAPYVLTERSWTLQPIWSPNGERLAYTGLDSSGFRQLYHSNPNGSESVQLTSFTSGIERIEIVQWSPDGRFLAFSTIETEGSVSLWNVLADGSNLQKANSGDFILKAGIWWDSDSARYAILADQWRDNHPVVGSDAVLWIDPITGNVLHTFELAIENINYEIVFPVEGAEKIAFLESDIVLYDVSSNTIQTISQSPFEGSIQIEPSQLLVRARPFSSLGETCPAPARFQEE